MEPDARTVQEHEGFSMRSRTLDDRQAAGGGTGLRTVAPPATKPRRFWFDPRFAIGLALVVVAVAGTAFVVGAADATIPVYGARAPLAVGERVTADDLVPVNVSIGAAEDLYFVPGELPDAGLIVTKPVAAGELVPASALGAVSAVDATTIVVPIEAQLAEAVAPGSGVDLWAAQPAEGGTFGPPTVIVPAASVVRLIEASGLVIDEASGSVELLVPRSRVARVLEAIANGDALSLVPTSLPAKG